MKHAKETDNSEDDEDVDNIAVADASLPRPESMLLRRSQCQNWNVLDRALKVERNDKEEAEDFATRVLLNSHGGLSPVSVPRSVVGLTSPVRIIIAAAVAAAL